MKKRIITGSLIAIVFIGVLCGTLLLSTLFYDVFIILISIGAIFELWRCLDDKHYIDVLILAFLAAFGCYAILMFDNSGFASLGWCFVVLLAAAVSEFVICMFLGRNIDCVKNFILILFYPTALIVCLLAINHLIVDELKFSAVLLMFTVSAFTDMFAYFGGTLIGGPKLCPAISPKKTVAGAVVGLCGGIAAAGLVILFALVPAFDFLNISIFATKTAYIVNILIMGVLGSVCTQIGDLVASFIKRQVGIKDFGKLLPGHGGIMDRIDGFAVNGFFLFVYTAIFQMLL